ncbi:MAG: DUF2118 domain-containing protein [Acidilobaceae archaeon]
MTLEYRPEDYIFPELYVEDGGGECVSVDLDRGVYRKDGGRALCKVIYEEGWRLIVDPVEARVSRSFLTLIPWMDYKGVYVERGARVELVEARGAEVYIVSREGSVVGENTVLAYILTRKGETRTRRARTRGVVAYIAWEPLVPPMYIFVIAKDYRILERAEG